jgi:L-lactate dehydrogenase complex protein LldG
LAARIEARQVCSVLPEAYHGNVDMASITDPHQLADVDLAILPGELAVAENAAVWVTGARVPQRVAYFLSQHVALVVPSDRVVDNMHEAYEWLHREAGADGPFATARWGTFMSGPSKTADIEQALVIGAHGARSLHVFLING